ncbi:MAG TPA: 50S ribosomal protein L6 [Candidatus Eisenbacteria bacterium]|nr:50S ribosomal protein L6 [Candidatus Eisenbacteria bacterium]
MSRIGRMPITVPSGVKVHVADGTVRVEGPKGKLTRTLPREVAVAVEGTTVNVSRLEETRRARGIHGLTRRLVSNMVEGVSKGFTRTLEINGVGYRADARGNLLHMTLGYSHPIAFQLPPGVTAKVDKQVTITLEGPDREMLGQIAAALRELRPPEPYKGKGMKYVEETIRRKAGKAAGAGAR